jgi:hypothetical protein
MRVVICNMPQGYSPSLVMEMSEEQCSPCMCMVWSKLLFKQVFLLIKALAAPAPAWGDEHKNVIVSAGDSHKTPFGRWALFPLLHTQQLQIAPCTASAAKQAPTRPANGLKPNPNPSQPLSNKLYYPTHKLIIKTQPICPFNLWGLKENSRFSWK